MAKQLFGNNASSLLAASISDSDLTIQLTTGFGALFPNPGADEYFLVTLENDSGDIEVVKITARSTDLLTVPTAGRGQEGTSAQAWTNGQARVELRLTRGTMEVFIQRGGDAMSGDLDMDGNDVIDAILSGTGTKLTAGEIVNVPLRGATGDASNEIAVPTDGSKATAGGQEILTEIDVEQITAAAFIVGQIILWHGLAVNIPDGWALCNGSSGTPDLRNRFVVGAGDTYALNATGGALSVTSSGGGAHTHSTETGAHALTVNEMPEHAHRMWVAGRGVSLGGSQNAYTSITDPAYTNTVPGGVGGGNDLIEETGGGAEHTHPGGTTNDPGNHTHDVATVPPYYGLFYIMFVGF
jgi:microcystin-dependent protein